MTRKKPTNKAGASTRRSTTTQRPAKSAKAPHQPRGLRENPQGIERRETADALIERARRDREVLESDIERMRGQIGDLSSRLTDSTRQLEWMTRTRSWTLTEPLRSSSGVTRDVREAVSAVPRRISEFVSHARLEGPLAAVAWARDVLRAGRKNTLGDEKDFFRRQLKTILARYPDRPIIVAPPLVDWNVPLFQRPQHLAMQLAAEGYLYFYCTGNAVYDRFEGFVQAAPGCFITNQTDLVMNLPRRKVVHLCSTAMRIDLTFVKTVKQRGDRLLYEYIDEIHPDISGEIPRGAMQRHYALLADENTACVATADKLLRDVESVRRGNYALVTNGVEYEHFARAQAGLPIPKELASVADSGRPVIGYFGALAKWFDYDMVRKLAKARPKYEIVLIGFDYDGSLKTAKLNQFKNIKVVGPINYRLLPRYAQLFDVSTIPFVVNDITESTSPIKLFEYMALGKPIVTSDLPECRKYESCIIAEDANAFVEQVDHALKLKADTTYQATLRREAEANTWRSKAREVSELLGTSFGLRPSLSRRS